MLRGKSDELIITQHKLGKYNTEYDKFVLNLIGVPFEIEEVEIDNVKVSLDELEFDAETTVFKVTKDFSEIHFKAKDER
jgi:alpha-glucosidase